MPINILYLFPDTNLFIHGKALNEIDWQQFAAFDEVQLVICRPTQKEIDKHKNRGSERLARRARTTSSLLREVINNGSVIVRQDNPCVKVALMVNLRPDPVLADRLNYGEPDDQLVGIVHAFQQSNPGADARVLTHDTGPMASGHMVGIPVFLIPDAWLRPPEVSEDEKKIRGLQEQVDRLRKGEPNFQIAFADEEGNNLDAIMHEVVRYEALTKAELDGLMDRIRARFPVATNFGARDPAERFAPFGNLNVGTRQVFTPATDEQITAYRDQRYPQWLKECERILRDYHKLIREQSAPLTFCVVAINDGTRPAKDALITVRANGHFKIRPPAYKDKDDKEDGDQQKAAKPIELPRPPSPPRGTWKSVNGLFDSLSATELLRRSAMGLGRDPMDFMRQEIHAPLFHDIPKGRDPNRFYYKPDRPLLPQSVFSLECAQWRHGIEGEEFEGEIYFKEDADGISGTLECRIEAENLSDPAIESIPVRIQIRKVSAYETVEKLVEALAGSGNQSPFAGLEL